MKRKNRRNKTTERRKSRYLGIFLVMLIILTGAGAAVAYLSGYDKQWIPGFSGNKTVVEKTDQRPKYEFYHKLPKQKVEVNPETSTPVVKSKPADKKTAPAKTAASGYLVQAGAFRLYSQAERRRAEVARLGFQSQVVEGKDGKGIPLFRVHIGPITDMLEVQKMRQQLKSNGIQTVAINQH